MPCGIADAGVTTLSEIVGAELTPTAVLPRVADAFAAAFDRAAVIA